jgi:hypothetical protein
MEDTVIHNQHTRIFIVGVHGLLLKKDVEEIQVSSYLIEWSNEVGDILNTEIK